MTRHSSMSSEELIRSCAESNDGAAWEEFVNRFHRPVSLSILRTAYHWGSIPRQLVDDLVQETYLKLCAGKCRLLRDFVSSHPEAVTAYIKTIAVNVARDYFKSVHAQKRGAAEIGPMPEDFEPRALAGSLGAQDAIEREILLRQVSGCLETHLVGPDQERDRLIFRLYYQQGMSAKSIAELPAIGLTAKGVESVISRLTRLVREHLVGLRAETSESQKSDRKGFRPAESY